MTDMTVANTILAQIGGNKFTAMTGAYSFCGSKDSLSFRLPSKNKAKCAGVRIELKPDDTYTMVFIGKTGPEFGDIGEVARHEGVYCDMLQEIFTSVTGLDTHL